MKAQMYNYSVWIDEYDPIKLSKIKDLLLKSGFGVLDEMEYNFIPQGYSCLYLLSESHLSVHTFPEESSTNIQLTSCVPDPFNKFIKIFMEWLNENKTIQQ